jgi:hypothetical protein
MTRRGILLSSRTDIRDGLPVEMTDRVQLQQESMNLMLNGIEARRDASS